MDTITLEVQSRDEGIKANGVRTSGLIPANFYGTNKKNQNLVVEYQSFRRTYGKAGGNTVLELVVDGKDKINVLVHDIQYDPVTDKFTHIDFVFVDLDKEVTTEVPLIAVGESKAVREDGGTLMQNRDTLTVKCIARNIPKQLEFDISGLEDFHSSIHIGDIAMPEGAVAVDDEKLTIATVVAPKVEEEPEEEVAEGEEGAEGEAPAEGGEAKKEEGAKEGGEGDSGNKEKEA
ncbi:50S ribosomal protein L25 [Patescibacteria group bacterium]